MGIAVQWDRLHLDQFVRPHVKNFATCHLFIEV